MTSSDYKQSFGYNGRRSLMAHAVRRMHADNAVRRGLGRMIQRRPIVEDRALRARAARARGLAKRGCGGARTGDRSGRCPRRDAGGGFIAAAAHATS